MSTDVVTKRITETSPRLKARMVGVLYLLMVSLGGLVQFARGRLVVKGDAAATAINILAHEPLFRLAFAADVLVVACSIAVTALFYSLFKPVNRSVSLLAAFFGLVGGTIQGFACLFEFAPLVVLGGTQHASVFDVGQLQALAYMFLKLYSPAYGIALVFFGFQFLLIGYLTFKSTFLPRILGVLMAFSGVGWLTFLSPSFGAKYLFPYILTADIGEASLVLWLLVFAVNEQRWREQAGAAGEW
ncbi:MAG: DUF4386 domain-containing protein [Acidobacteriia bacterium]|nr:DUF4386 domain-containing protein [Terriglobia bacterium]